MCSSQQFWQHWECQDVNNLQNLCITGFLISFAWGHPYFWHTVMSATVNNWIVETLYVMWSLTTYFVFIAIPVQVWTGPCGFWVVGTPRFQDSWHMKVTRLSALWTGCLYPQGDLPCTHFCYRLSWLLGHSVTGRIMSTKNSNDTVRNQTRDLPACSSEPQPTAPPRTLTNTHYSIYICHHSVW